MRRRSAKTTSIYAEWLPKRLAFLNEKPVCCKCNGLACDIHEIVGGGSRMKAFVERATWLRVCRTCHDVLQYDDKSLQLALKLLTDPEFFSIKRVCEVWGRAITAIDPYDVLDQLAVIQIGKLYG